MKLIVRLFVVALAVTGAIATTAANGSTAKTAVVASKTSAMPIPSCPPSAPNGCGIADSW